MDLKEIFRTVVLFILTIEARFVLWRFHPRIILVTGSVGKTSTKDAIYAALQKKVFVRKSEKSFNSDIGVPLTILGLPNGWSNVFVWLMNIMKGAILPFSGAPYPQWLVIEVGADRPGDISRSLSWLRPQIVVTTRFPDIPVHVEFYSSPDAVAEEELSPVSFLAPGGVCVINGDEKRTESLPLPEGVERVSYGKKKGVTVRKNRLRFLTVKKMVAGISFDIEVGDDRFHLSFPGVVGEGVVYATLGAVATAKSAGVSVADAIEGLQSFVSPPGRLRLISGIKGSVIIDDSYNASPVAVTEALETLGNVPRTGRTFAVLGDMLELGTYSKEAHESVGALLKNSEVIVTVGVRAREYQEGARKAGVLESNMHAFERVSDATSFLLEHISEGDVILIKGSQGMRMERIVKALMAEPEQAEHLLVRQDAEWLSR